MKYIYDVDDDSYSLREAQQDCSHTFVSKNNRFLSPFDEGLRCTRCGLEVDEDYEEDEDEDDDEYDDDFDDLDEDEEDDDWDDWDNEDDDEEELT